MSFTTAPDMQHQLENVVNRIQRHCKIGKVTRRVAAVNLAPGRDGLLPTNLGYRPLNSYWHKLRDASPDYMRDYFPARPMSSTA